MPYSYLCKRKLDQLDQENDPCFGNSNGETSNSLWLSNENLPSSFILNSHSGKEHFETLKDSNSSSSALSSNSKSSTLTSNSNFKVLRTISEPKRKRQSLMATPRNLLEGFKSLFSPQF